MSFAVLRTPVKVKPIKPVKKGKKEMSLEEFLQKLLATTEWFNWENDPNDGSIRGTLIAEKAGKVKVKYCPITAVAYIQSGLLFSDFDFNRAARKIRLSVKTRDLIVSAADRRSITDRLYNDLSNALRQRMLSALNLTEKRRRGPRLSPKKHK